MARFFPSAKPAGLVSSESRTWDALMRLDDDWRVFHSVPWQSFRNGRQGDGEADFILLNRKIGLIILEVKGGRLDVTDGVWTSTDRHGVGHRIKNPYQQATDSKFTLLRKLQELRPALANIPPVLHGVVFPDGEAIGSIGLAGDAEITISRSDLERAPEAVERLVSHWGESCAMPTEVFHRITSLLAPTTTIEPRLRTNLNEALAEQIRLTDAQLQAMRLVRKMRRTALVGGPGTGKTILAAERASQLADEGLNVLLTCYNSPLGAHLKSGYSRTNLQVETFHSWCMASAAAAGMAVPSSPNADWWANEAALVVLEANSRLGGRYDAVIIDEAQDFEMEWVEALLDSLIDPSSGTVTLAADAAQALRRPGWTIPVEFEALPLDVNCRSTAQIVRRVERVINRDPSMSGPSGPEPMFYVVQSIGDAVEKVQAVCDRLISDEGLDPREIVILCESRSTANLFKGKAVSEAVFGEVGTAGIGVDTIARFKGLEAPTVLLVFNSSSVDDSNRAEAYVGLSRARTLLMVFGTAELKQSLEWTL